jgi:hypothetical protein
MAGDPRRQNEPPIAAARSKEPWVIRYTRRLSFRLIHSRSLRFTGDRGPTVRAGHGRWRTVVNGDAQSSKACEEATPPRRPAAKPCVVTIDQIAAPDMRPDRASGSAFRQVRAIPGNGLGSCERRVPQMGPEASSPPGISAGEAAWGAVCKTVGSADCRALCTSCRADLCLRRCRSLSIFVGGAATLTSAKDDRT